MESSPTASLILTTALAVIMFSLGTTLRGDQFRLVFTRPRGVLVGVLNLFVIAPALAFLVAEVTRLDPPLAAGLMLLGAAPGGVFANLLTHFARGATALSISMTAISSVLAVITVPFWLGIALATFDVGEEVDLDMVPVVLRVVLSIALPLALGMLLVARFPDVVARHRVGLERLAVGTFALIVVVAVATQTQTVLDNLGPVVAATLLLNLAAMGAGFAISSLARLSPPESTAISIEVGVHNAGLAVAIGAAVDDRLAIPAAVYASFMILTAGAFALYMGRRNHAAAA